MKTQERRGQPSVDWEESMRRGEPRYVGDKRERESERERQLETGNG